jgi:RNA polymerase sigma-32 factor
VTEEEVTSMNRRMAMGGDTSLNVPMREDGEASGRIGCSRHARCRTSVVAEAQEADVRHDMLVEAMDDSTTARSTSSPSAA